MSSCWRKSAWGVERRVDVHALDLADALRGELRKAAEGGQGVAPDQVVISRPPLAYCASAGDVVEEAGFYGPANHPGGDKAPGSHCAEPIWFQKYPLIRSFVRLDGVEPATSALPVQMSPREKRGLTKEFLLRVAFEFLRCDPHVTQSQSRRRVRELGELDCHRGLASIRDALPQFDAE